MKIKQFFITTFISVFIGFLIGTVFGLVLGVKVIRDDSPKELISSTVVVDKIKDQSFLITRTLVTDQKVDIEIDYDSPWSQFFWGHKVSAEGVMQVDVGVNLTDITENDIEITNDDKTIKINLPDAEVYDTSLSGPIEVSTKSGVFKKLFDTDDNADYNLALSELKAQAESSVTGDEEFLKEAKSSALSTLQAIFKDTGYIVVEN
ncbi:MAG: DUF4230 domain-containing protein [Candidatus Dojkabacteria bacterium]|nr:DUF4230 domain-containing protein [Candidatus Dojkabacteria bacterium]